MMNIFLFTLRETNDKSGHGNLLKHYYKLNKCVKIDLNHRFGCLFQVGKSFRPSTDCGRQISESTS